MTIHYNNTARQEAGLYGPISPKNNERSIYRHLRLHQQGCSFAAHRTGGLVVVTTPTTVGTTTATGFATTTTSTTGGTCLRSPEFI